MGNYSDIFNSWYNYYMNMLPQRVDQVVRILNYKEINQDIMLAFIAATKECGGIKCRFTGKGNLDAYFIQTED